MSLEFLIPVNHKINPQNELLFDNIYQYPFEVATVGGKGVRVENPDSRIAL